MNKQKEQPKSYSYYFVRVEDKKQSDFPACVELDLSDISQEWIDILHEEELAEETRNRYERRLQSNAMKNPARFCKAILGPEEAFFQKELAEQMGKAMAALTPRQLLLVEAVVIDKRKKVDVARELGIDEAMVRKQLKGAIKKLQKNL